MPDSFAAPALAIGLDAIDYPPGLFSVTKGDEYLVQLNLVENLVAVGPKDFRETKRDRDRPFDWMPTEARPDRGDLRHDMSRVFAELKPQERALLWLAHVEGNSHEEIAAAIGVKSKSIKVMLFRARKRLGEMLTKKGLAPEVTR